MKVSIIIPAFNSSSTISDTINSIRAQTFKEWEAIVVDDGSTDNTVDVVLKCTESDNRIHLISGNHCGVGAARNLGIKNAKYDWLLFLDSDDWIANNHLELLTNELKRDPSLDAVYSKFARADTTGKIIQTRNFNATGDLFSLLGRTCAFTIHSCLLRKSLIEEVSCFDTSLKTNEDWDLWQKIARCGANFGYVDEVLAFYCMRQFSASNDGFQMVKDGLLVLERGHSEDPRVPNPKPEHKAGLCRDELVCRKYHTAFWGIGLAIGNKKDPLPLLELIEDAPWPAIEPYGIAETLFESVLLPTCRTKEDWVNLLPEIENGLDVFLDALEMKTKAARLKQRVRKSLELKIVEEISIDKPILLGKTYRTNIEVTKKQEDLILPAGIERIGCNVLYKGEIIGTIELPVFDNCVPADILTDAIADKFCWDILGKFFSETIYKQFSLEKKENKIIIKRNGKFFAELADQSENMDWDSIHERIGWTIFLQEVWNMPTWNADMFYDPELRKLFAGKVKAKDDWFIFDIGSKLKNVAASSNKLNVLVAVGGEKIGIVTIEAKNHKVNNGRLRAEILTKTGLELCRAVVKNAVLGEEFDSALPLRARLAALYEQKSLNGNRIDCSDTKKKKTQADNNVIIGRRFPLQFGTSTSRRAVFPKALFREIILSSQTNHDFISNNVKDGEPDKVIYNPEVIELPVNAKRTMEVYSEKLRAGDAISNSALNSGVSTSHLPILMYHRIAQSGAKETLRYRTTPDNFYNQMKYLYEYGYHATSLDEWGKAIFYKKPLPGKGVVITFDDGYKDFYTHAFPILKEFGFTATLFLVANHVGKFNFWDNECGERTELMDWDEIRELQQKGIEFGSHSLDHSSLTSVTPTEVVLEAVKSREIIARELSSQIVSFAYPYGDVDETVRHIIGACGYLYGLTAESYLSTLEDRLLFLPRIEVTGSDTIESFSKKLSAE